MSRAEDDEIERLLREGRAAESAANARLVSGDDVRILRGAVADAAKALGLIKTKALPFAHRRNIETARAALEDARVRLTRIAAQQDAGPQAGA